MMFIYVPQRRSTAAARTWLLFIFLLPWPGLFLYWLFGRIYLPAHRIKMQERASEFVRLAQEQIGARVTVDPKLPAVFKFVPGLVHKLGRFDLRNHRKIVVVDGRVGYTGSQNIVNPEFVKGYDRQ